MWIEIVGILAGCFVLASFVMKGETNIRSVNLIGAILFVIYGFIAGAIAIWAINLILALIHIYYLYKSLPNLEQEEVNEKVSELKTMIKKPIAKKETEIKFKEQKDETKVSELNNKKNIEEKNKEKSKKQTSKPKNNTQTKNKQSKTSSNNKNNNSKSKKTNKSNYSKKIN